MSEDIREIRLQKLQSMIDLGHDPYKVEDFKRTGLANELLDRFEVLAGSESAEPQIIRFAGRVVSYRDMGKAGFAHLSDGDGKIQIYCRKDELSRQPKFGYSQPTDPPMESGQALPSNTMADGGDGKTVDGWKLYQLLDIGDHVGVEGFMFLTKTGEKSIHVKRLVPLSKSLQVLPIGKTETAVAAEVQATKSWYGLEDIDTRYRHRHLDLITNPGARKALLDRAKIVSAVRRYFDGAGYLEVETPLLQVVAGGAAARPFTTHYNAYDMDVKLRISLELYLKRLICGDIPAVYEIGRVFRNEGVSNRHNPEFTLLEFYEAYANLDDMMEHVQKLFAFVAKEVLGTTVIRTKRPVGEFFNRYSSFYHSGPAWLAPIDASKSFSDRVVLDKLGLTKVKEIPKLMGSAMYASIKKGRPKFYRDAGGHEFVLLTRNALLSKEIRMKRGWYEFAYFEATLLDGMFAGGEVIDFNRRWHTVQFLEAIQQKTGIPQEACASLQTLKDEINRLDIEDRARSFGSHIDVERENNLGGLLEKLLEVFVEPTLQEPTFVVGYPIETSPLAKKDPNNPRMTRRFEGYILGREICNAFSEINDPIDQKERFEQQAAEIAKGDDEAHPYDEEFLYALEGGMPPTGGCGIGMERLAMVLTGSDHIREIMFFPMMKPRE